MKRLTPTVCVLVVLATACGGGDATADEIAGETIERCSEGRIDDFPDRYAPEAVFIYQDEPQEAFWAPSIHPASAYGLAQAEDFDGDGTKTLADIFQAQCALFSGLWEDVEWECTATESDSTQCTFTDVLKFGESTYPHEHRFTTEDGQIVIEQQLAVDPDALDAGTNAWAEGMQGYRAWVRAIYPETFDQMFLNDLPIMLPESAELHNEMMDEYFSSQQDDA